MLSSRMRRIRLVALWAPLVASPLSCAEIDPAPRAARSGPNVVLIVVDTLRADRLAEFEDERGAGHGLRRFAAEATRFEQCFAPAPWTTPSTATVLSGLHPLRHGSTRQGSVLDGDVASLAEVVSDSGWQTVGFSFNHNVSGTSGFDQGFDRFDEFIGRSTAYPHISEMVDSARTWLYDELQDQFLLYMQPMNAHGPYLVPEEHRAGLLGRAPRSGFTYYGSTMRAILKKGQLERREGVSDGMLASLGEQYDTAVRYTTDQVGQLLETLRELELYDSSLIIITADHGEELFEHGGFSHGYSLHREVLQVPLLIKLPGQRLGQVHTDPVSLADIYPTVLDVLDVPAPYVVDGISLLPVLREGAESPAGDAPGSDARWPQAFAATRPRTSPQAERALTFHVDWGKRCVARAIVSEGFKLLIIEQDYSGAENITRLYDLQADPGETQDLSAARPQLVRRLTRQLEATQDDLSRRRLANPDNVLDRMDTQALQALGYLH
jgi:arylsulfatase A-like enzyme